MDIEENQDQSNNPVQQFQPHCRPGINDNEPKYLDIQKNNSALNSSQKSSNPQNIVNRQSFKSRLSNESFQSWGRMSIEEMKFAENQKISLESNISAKAMLRNRGSDLLDNLANEGTNNLHFMEMREENSLNNSDLKGHMNEENGSTNMNLYYSQHTDYLSPFFNSTQEFKQRNSEGTNEKSNIENRKGSKEEQEAKNHHKQKSLQVSVPKAVEQKPIKQAMISCKCPKSKCLLMYCECFSKGVLCNPSCSCYQCRNNPDFETKRQNARKVVLERDPNAFSNKLEIIGGEDSELANKRGCNCKKTKCFKKYCECFFAGVKCTYLCKCENCMNGGENSYKG